MNSTTDDKIKICLYDLSEVGLIIKSDSNSVYYNQVGGKLCEHREIEGAYIPVCADDDPLDFQASLKYKLSQLFLSSEVADFKTALAINELMSDSLSTKGISVNFEKLAESLDGWVHVNVKPSAFSALQNGGIYEGILTWSNNLD